MASLWESIFIVWLMCVIGAVISIAWLATIFLRDFAETVREARQFNHRNEGS